MAEFEVGAGVRFTPWTEDEFRASREPWQALLARSAADPLFNSWDWQWRWWQHNAPLLDARLQIEAMTDAAGQLIAIVPMYVRQARHRLFRGERLELLGRAWRSHRTVFSEYCDIIVARGYEDRVVPAIVGRLLSGGVWSDLVMSNVKPDSVASRVAEALVSAGAYARSADPLSAYTMVLTGTYEDVLRQLSANTRRRVHNQRKRLVEPTLKPVSDAEIGETLALIDRFHDVRWGQRHVHHTHTRFHTEFAMAMASHGALRMTQLQANGQVLSAMYNVRVNGTEYNIQQGFDSRHARGLSPGYLHFGYAIEEACKAGLAAFDFLAGAGRRRDYKQDFVENGTRLVTWQVIRAQPLAWLYRQYDRRFASGSRLVRA